MTIHHEHLSGVIFIIKTLDYILFSILKERILSYN